ncbi:MAG TPA: hypothetical protein VJV05_08180 [Pyrinomonadaceae bacterium]|nr:hypothetical protein [Pyrinomonadaceae bacterium]
MSLFSIKKTLVGVSIVLSVVLLGSSATNAQTRRDRERELRRIEQNARWDRQQKTSIARQQSTSRRDIANAYFSQGYEQGYLAGVSDARRKKYNRSNVYRETGSAPNLGDPTSSDYIYRQGYLAGYEDGYHRRRNL